MVVFAFLPYLLVMSLVQHKATCTLAATNYDDT